MPVHRTRAKETLKLDTMLNGSEFIEAKISKRGTLLFIEGSALGLEALVDCREELAPPEINWLRLFHRTLQMSANILDADPSQLASRLVRRVSQLENQLAGIKLYRWRCSHFPPEVSCQFHAVWHDSDMRHVISVYANGSLKIWKSDKIA